MNLCSKLLLRVTNMVKNEQVISYKGWEWRWGREEGWWVNKKKAKIS